MNKLNFSLLFLWEKNSNIVKNNLKVGTGHSDLIEINIK